jgi:hypothetical protein
MTKFYISANKTLVSNGQIKIRVDNTQNTTTTAAPAVLTVARAGGSSTFTGSGTSASPYTRVARIRNDSQDGLMADSYGVGGGGYAFTAQVSGTAYVTCTFYDEHNEGNIGFIKKNGVHGSDLAGVQGSIIFDGTTVEARSFSVISGDVIILTADSYLTSFENVSVWVVPTTTTTAAPTTTTTTTTAAPQSLSFAAAYIHGSPLPSGDASDNSYSLSGLGTVDSPTTLVLGAGDNGYNRVWLQIARSGTLSYTVTVSSESNYDYGSLYKSSGPPSSNTSLTGFTTIVNPMAGINQTASGTVSVTQGEFLILMYTKDDSADDGADRVTFSGYITTPTTTTTTTTTTAPSFTPMAVLLTSGTSYTVPAGAASMKVWAVGGGGGSFGGAGGTAFNTWSVSGGDTIAYNIGAAGLTGNNNATTTNGGDTIATYNGTTITGMGGKRYWSHPDIGQGGGWTSNGGGANGGSGDGRGGAVGGNSQPVLICAGYSENGRRPATNVSGLLEALALAGINTTQTCGSTAAFGSGGHNGEKNGAQQSAGLGGGGGRIDGVQTAGGGALILYFTSEPFTPTPFTPMAVLLTSGTSYMVPGGATSMKAWAVGPGGTSWDFAGGAGGTAFKTWSVMGGNTVAYVIGGPGWFGDGRSGLYSGTGTPSTVTFGGTTITGNPGQGGYIQASQPGAGGSYSGGDGGANGGNGGSGARAGGAVGGNSQSILVCSGYESNGRRPATNVSGLLEAVALAGGTAIQTCSGPNLWQQAAFGSGGGYGEKWADALMAGVGGGGAFYFGGGGAVVLYFT